MKELNWTDEGKEYIKMYKHPKFWVYNEKEKKFYLRLIDRIIDLPKMWPVEVNHLESKAYLNYLNKKNNTCYRLMSEFEFHKIILDGKKEKINDLNKKYNINLNKFHSSNPIDYFEYENSEIFDIIGKKI
jgi:hypothetical protein